MARLIILREMFESFQWFIDLFMKKIQDLELMKDMCNTDNRECTAIFNRFYVCLLFHKAVVLKKCFCLLHATASRCWSVG